MGRHRRKNVFIKYDIKDFYSFIYEQGLLEVLHFAQEFINLPPEQVEIILHCRKSFLFHNNNTWRKIKKVV